MAGNFGSMTKNYHTTRFFHSIFSVESENAISLPSTLLEQCSRGGEGEKIISFHTVCGLIAEF